MRGGKGDLYENGIRVPLVMCWPGVIKPSAESNEVVISNDFFATFNEIAGVKSADKNDGLSLLPLLKGNELKLGRDAVYWHYPHYHGNGLGPQGAIRCGNFKLIEWFETGTTELYDLSTDPEEQQNLSSLQPTVADSLQSMLQDWRMRIGARMPTPNPDYDPPTSR